MMIVQRASKCSRRGDSSRSVARLEPDRCSVVHRGHADGEGGRLVCRIIYRPVLTNPEAARALAVQDKAVEVSHKDVN